MKKNNQSHGKRVYSSKPTETKEPETSEKPTLKTPTDFEDEETGFGGWLRSSDGMETMKLFVIANSIVLLTTLAFPQMQIVFGIISDAIYGPDALY